MKNVKYAIWLTVVVLMIASCSVPQIKVPSQLTTDTSMYTVKGRFGFTWNKVISFGGYTTSKFNKGWTTTASNNSDILKMRSAKQKFKRVIQSMSRQSP